MVKKGSVALITPCYNGEKYLNTWFDCIMRQTYQNVEIFVVDDGSTDKSAEILKSFENKFIDKGYTFHYYYQENAGIAAAIQLAIKDVNTDYMYLYDTDDYIYENAIETMANFLNVNANYDMVRCNGYYTRNLSENKEGMFYTSDRLKNKENIFTSLVKGETVNFSASYMIRADVLFGKLNDRTIYISEFGQNMQIMLPVAYSGKCGYIDEPLMEYTIREDSDSHKGGYERKVYMTDGYTKNRIETIKMLDMSDNEKERYIKLARDACALRKLDFMYEYGNKDLYFQEYKRLKAEGIIDKNAEMKYLRRRYKFIDFCAKARNKLVRILCKR